MVKRNHSEPWLQLASAQTQPRGATRGLDRDDDATIRCAPHVSVCLVNAPAHTKETYLAAGHCPRGPLHVPVAQQSTATPTHSVDIGSGTAAYTERLSTVSQTVYVRAFPPMSSPHVTYLLVLSGAAHLLKLGDLMGSTNKNGASVSMVVTSAAAYIHCKVQRTVKGSLHE